ncbi:MAG: pyridoxamine 5'-phosphate oxidase family protein [Oscillospiraceae bacterium]|jgi:uncharacterized pyridoxamine 5'-phosphate oxidase family protein|nr:pyridoxamine 5'-phosphate oxidase family protein [Oscillospiraceae bacterium]
MNKATELLKAAGTFYVATVEGDQPRVRPFGAVAEVDGKTYICMNNTKKVFAQLKVNPKAEITGMVGQDWFRITANILQDDRAEAREAFLAQNEMLRGMYKADDGIYEVLYLANAKGTLESFSGSKQEF